MKKYDSDIFGTLWEPESFSELLDIVNSKLNDSLSVRMWRGQGDISWPVHSTAYRRLRRNKEVVVEKDLIHYESWLLKQATHKGHRFLNGHELSDIELLARLQHHGAATRLVDATRSALVALWFVVSTHPKKTGSLVGLHTWYLGGYEAIPMSEPYVELIKGTTNLLTWEPTAVSPRVAAQHSQFMFSQCSDAKTGSLIMPSEEGGMLIIAISPKFKKIAREILIEEFDIRTVTLFPDLDGFCMANTHEVDKADMFRW